MCRARPSESHRTKANEAHGRLAHMGTGLLTDCTGLSLVVRVGFKGLYTERWEHSAGHFCILSIMRANKGILSLSWLICVLVCLERVLVCERGVELCMCARRKSVHSVCMCVCM